MRVIDVDEARAHLLRLIGEAAGGEPFVIARAGTPLVKVVAARTNRRLGFMAGQVSVPDDFDRMGREEFEELFGPESGLSRR